MVTHYNLQYGNETIHKGQELTYRMGSHCHDGGRCSYIFSYCSVSVYLAGFISFPLMLSLCLSRHINQLIIIYWQQESNAEDIVMQSSVNKIQLLRKQVGIHEISRLPARLCPPRQKRYQWTNGPTDRRTDTPSYRVVAHD